jgi:hypothetical protein
VERFNMELSPRGLRRARPLWFIRLFVGLPARKVHARAARCCGLRPPPRGCSSPVQENRTRIDRNRFATRTLDLSAHEAANNRPACKVRVLIFSRCRREIAAIEGRAVCPAATFIGGHLG